jgi:hypothetical protein
VTDNTVVSNYKHTDGDIALEVTGIIQKIYRHILIDNCDHCRAVLNNNNNNEARVPSRTSTKTATHHNPSKELGVLQ